MTPSSIVRMFSVAKEARDLLVEQAGVSNGFSPSSKDVDSATQRPLCKSFSSPGYT